MQNSLPSGSVNVIQCTPHSSFSCTNVAPSVSRRARSDARAETSKSRCIRFLAVLGSGTFRNKKLGSAGGAPGSIAMYSLAPSATSRLSSCAQNAASAPGLEQSNVMLLIVGIPYFRAAGSLALGDECSEQLDRLQPVGDGAAVMNGHEFVGAGLLLENVEVCGDFVRRSSGAVGEHLVYMSGLW
jgi:hypothetical protein